MTGEPRTFRVPLPWRRASRYHERLRPHVRQDGRLNRVADGGYPLYYVVRSGRYEEAVCPSCAADVHEHDIGATVTNADVNWEDPSMFCDCGERIPSAYAECDKCDNGNVSTPGLYHEACGDETCTSEHLATCIACGGEGAVPNCEDCDGRGKVRLPLPDKSAYPYPAPEGECRSCHGTGKRSFEP